MILGKDVALEYLAILREIGVSAGLAKSIVSLRGVVLEFAKKFFVPERADMAPFRESIAARLSVRLASAFADKYALDWTTLLRFYGYGFKARS